MEEKRILLIVRPESALPSGAAERIRAIDPLRELRITTDTNEIEACLGEVEIVAGNFPPGLITRAPNLKWVATWSAGADWLQKYPETKQLPFRLTTASGIHGGQMSEQLFGLLITHTRRLRQAFEAQSRHEWLSVSHTDLDTLAGKSMLIVGYGSIGEQVARRAVAFGMKVVGLRRRPERIVNAKHPIEVEVAGLDELDQRLADADVVVNILPYTSDTRGFFDEARFSRMKRTSLFANIGRGGTVDEAALIAALKRGTIAAAATDVASEEPLPSSSPLWSAPNLLITSHYSGSHPRYDELAFEVFMDNLDRYARGVPLRNEVDKNAGY